MESVSFKVHLKRDDQVVEVRRFGVDSGASTSLVYLRGKIQAMFPSIQNDQFTILWQDAENDFITIDSDEELVEALTASTVRPVKMFVNDNGTQQKGPTFGDAAGQIHQGVTCDGCGSPVIGFRYKCLSCSDFDLCAACEASGKHSEHIMLRIPDSLSQPMHPKFLKKVFGRPHKLAHHMYRHCNRNARPDSSGMSENPRPGCPMADRGMGFSFNEMRGLIESLGIGQASGNTNSNASANPTSGQATSGTQTKQGQVSSTQTTNSEGFRPTDYLNTVGQAVAAFLDPLGIPTKKNAKTMKKIMKKNKKGLRKHNKGHFKKPVLAYRMNCCRLNHHHMLGGPKLHEGHRHKPTLEQWHGHHDIPNHGRKCSPKHWHGIGPKHGHGFGPKYGHHHHFSHGQKHSHGFKSGFRNLQPLIIDLCAEDGIDVSFEVRPKASETQGQSTPTNPTTPTPAPPAPTTVNSPATPAPSASPASFTTPPQSTSSVNEPVVAQPEPSQSGHARRNSDDWTLLNRESPHRNDDVAMDVDNASARGPNHVYPELPKESASAPPQQDAALERERQKIQEAVERIRSMGFDFETSVLQDLLRTQNCNIASVLEMILSNAVKK